MIATPLALGTPTVIGLPLAASSPNSSYLNKRP
jgi:hypothetical protein